MELLTVVGGILPLILSTFVALKKAICKDTLKTANEGRTNCACIVNVTIRICAANVNFISFHSWLYSTYTYDQ